MAQTVVLLHTQPDKPDHYDWLIDQPECTAEHRLVTFRVQVRPDRNRSFTGEKVADHRAFYLDYEGPLSQGRGEVLRVAMGTVGDLTIESGQITGKVNWGSHRAKFVGNRIEPNTIQWRFECTPMDED